MNNLKYINLIILSTLLLAACSTNKKDIAIFLDRPEDTNLEFWITQRVTFKDLDDKGCTYLPGWMGASLYLDSRYDIDTSEEMAMAPKIHVTYLITGYPDTLDDKTVTHIEITDPSIIVYGLNLYSTDTEITNRMSEIADSYSCVATVDDHYISCKIKNCTFSFTKEKIVIDVPVTNKYDVEY